MNISVVGCGYWGPNLIRNFNALGSLYSIHDNDQTKLSKELSKYPNLIGHKSYKDLLNDPNIDGVVIATPMHTHFDLASQALNAGKNVLLEKPLTNNSLEAEKLIEIADKNKTILMVDHTFLYSEHIEYIKKLIQSGEIGDLAYINSRRLNMGLLQKDFNVVWDLMPHDLSILMHVTGLKIKQVQAISNKSYLKDHPESVADINLFLENNVLAHISVGWIVPVKIRDTMFVGKKKTIIYDTMEHVEKIKIFDKSIEASPNNILYREGDIYAPYIEETEPLKRCCNEFINCIKTGNTPKTSGQEGYEVVKIIEAINESAENDGKIISL